MNEINKLDATELWLTVPQATLLCAQSGLPRTIKTIRRWAQRSSENPDQPEIIAQKQDTENGFRWLIERNSLDVKIAQELEFDRRATEGQVRSPEHTSLTGPDIGAAVPPEGTTPDISTPLDDMSGQERADFSQRERFEADASIVEFLKKQIEVKDRQIESLMDRDRETNVLLQGLQSSLSGVVNALPPRIEVRSERGARNSEWTTEWTNSPMVYD
ncbi:MAG: hypothetical protein IPK28_00085 [Devosia sp.]|nr:hypothetical protein [Devosia sp.]